jgi:hypothetical protein
MSLIVVQKCAKKVAIKTRRLHQSHPQMRNAKEETPTFLILDIISLSMDNWISKK